MIDAKVIFENNKPCLKVDGKIVPPLFYALSDIPASRSYTAQAQRNIKNFAECGINIVCVDTCIHYGWKKGEKYDPSEPLREVRGAVCANPKAYVIIRLHLNPPYWWMKENESELYCYYGVESTDRGSYGDRLIAYDDQHDMRVSLASEKWKSEAGAILRELCQALSGDECGQRVIGIHVACGLYGEWHPWGFFNYDGDYSPAMEKFFRTFLKQKYGDGCRLRAAWGDENADFDSAKLPLPEERKAASCGRFRLPERDMKSIDGFKAMQKAITSAIAHFARIVKEELPSALVGVFYGYFFNTTWTNNKATEGGCHLEIGDIYANPDVDYIAAPFCYTDTRVAGNSLRLRCLLESARLNGKLCLCEMDQAPRGSDVVKGGLLEFREESVSLLKRNILSGLIHGMGAWYYDHRLVPNGSIYEKNGWWDHPDLISVIMKMRVLAEEITAKRFVKTGGVLLVCDTERFYYLADGKMTRDEVEFAFHDALGKSGAGYDAVYLADLEKVDLDSYRAVIFYDCVILTEKQLNFIKEKVCDKGRTVAFLGDTGAILDGKRDKNAQNSLYDEGFFSDVKTERARIIHSEELIFDSKYWRRIFSESGAHIWVRGGEVAVVDDGYVLIHGKGVAESEVFLPDGRVIRLKNGEFFTYLIDVASGKVVM